MTNPLIEEIIKLRETGKLQDALEKVDALLLTHEKEKNTK